MLKISKKVLSILLADIMIFSVFMVVPFKADALEIDTKNSISTWNDDYKKMYVEFLKEIHDNPQDYVKLLEFDGKVELKDIEENDFAIGDINQDSIDDLIVFFTNTYTSCMYTGVWTIDKNTNSVVKYANLGVSCEFYNNGTVKVNASHNQSLGWEVWPYTLYRYDKSQSAYISYANAYSVEKKYDYTGKEYSIDKDVDKDGVIYYFEVAGQKSPLTLEEYNSYTNKYIPENSRINLNLNKLNYDNINSIVMEHLTSGLKIYSDHTNLNVKKGDSINIGAGIFTNNQQITDISKLTFSVDDTSVLSVSNTSVHDNCRFLTLKAKKTGTTYVTFNDSKTGYVTRVPITVYDNNLMAFTVSGVPTQKIEKYTTNFYNVNGLFVDSYTYNANSNKTTTVSFDVYNTNYIYGAVEVYNSEGSMTDAVIIDKMTNNAGSIKSTVWDNSCCLVRDIIDGDLLSYRQESGYSKKTFVKVTIPENGYIKITTDTSSSFLVGLVNGVDVLMSLKSIAGDIKGFDVNSKAFADKITKKLVKEAIYAQFIKDEDKYAKSLFKNVAKKSTIFDSESLGNFAETFVNNLSSLKLEDLVFDTAVDFGWGVGESVFEYFAGPIGMVLKGMFAFGDIANFIIENNHYIKSSGCGCIAIQNQGGGVRTASNVTVTSDTNFNSDTALKVFEVKVDSDLLDIVKKADSELYERIISDLSITYNISMIKDGKEVQPQSEVEVSIPIPENLLAYAYTGKLKIYRVEDDGTTTEMDVKVKNGCLVFKTTHFSLYSLMVPIGKEKPADVNFDGKITVDDATNIQKCIAGMIEFSSTQESIADVDGDGKVGISDVTEIQKYLVGLQSVLKDNTVGGNDDYIKIYTDDDFINISNNLSGKYILMNDISFELSSSPSIGSYSDPFTGVLDGNGYTVALGENDSYVAGGNYSRGLFGYTDGAEIKNLKISGELTFVINVSIRGCANYCGGIAGFAKNTKFDNCSNSANIISSDKNNGSANTSAYAYAGGIAGWCDGGSMTNCSNSGTIKAFSNTNLRADAVSGGLSGVCSGTTIKNCSNTGYIYSSSITSSPKYWAIAYSGGLVGQNSSGSMSGCSNSGTVKSSCLPKVATSYNSAAASGGLIGYGKINYGSCTVSTNDITAENNSYSKKYTDKFIGYTP